MNTEILITNILHKIYSMYKILIYNPKMDIVENFTQHDDGNMFEPDWTIGSAPEGYIKGHESRTLAVLKLVT